MDGVDGLTALKVFMRIMLTFSFAGSLFTLIDVEAYKKLNQILMREYGVTRRILPLIEETKSTVEEYIIKNRKILGSLFLLLSFILLTLY
ncbi:MAG: hypothetical protein FJZ10_04545 [Candidatus Omnitrophica bacterium]|nr:hypothetical protein [Candidatus Omnitrophota bacterium]